MNRADRHHRRDDRRVATIALALATLAGVGVGAWAGHTDAPTTSVVIVQTPPWADTTAEDDDTTTTEGDPYLDDERWQDPSGLPYCLAEAPIYPCIDLNDGGAIVQDPTTTTTTKEA